MKALLDPVLRLYHGLRRPSKTANLRQFARKGQSINDFTIREATENDLEALVKLHVVTWNDTYPLVRNKPSYQLRLSQWKQAFTERKSLWFCYVVQKSREDLVGFATGNAWSHPILPYKAQLNKIYLLRDYQRLGLGNKLFCKVIQHFLQQGMNSMILFSEPANPSIRFYEAMGGIKVLDENGKFHGAYGWKDLTQLMKSHQKMKDGNTPTAPE